LNKDELTLVYVTKWLIDLFTEAHPYFHHELGVGFLKGIINIFHIFRDYGFSIRKTEFDWRVTAKPGLEWGPFSHDYRMKIPSHLTGGGGIIA
jgi:hypothetical protein